MKMRSTDPRLLWFHSGPRVEENESSAAFAITNNVGFRNANVKVGDRLEECDAIAGNPPAEYRAEYFMVSTLAQLRKAAADRKAGKKPETEEDDDTPEVVVEEVGPDLTDKSEDYRSGFEAGKVRADYGDPSQVSQDFRDGYAEGLKLAPALEKAPKVKKAAAKKAAKPKVAKATPKPPVFGANT